MAGRRIETTWKNKESVTWRDGMKEEQKERGMLSKVERPECKNTEPSRHEKMIRGIQLLLRGQRIQYFMHELLSSSPEIGGVQNMKFQPFGVRDWALRNLV